MFPPDNITNSSFELTWFYQVGSEPIDKFSFHIDSSTSSSLREKKAGPRSFSLTFTGLSSCTTYEIYGIAVGTMGQVSEKSDAVSVTTRLTPLEDSQIWSDGDRVIVHYEGKSLPLCITNNLTYHHHQAAKVCSLAAELPPKSGEGRATSAFQTEMTFTTESSSFRSLLQSCLHEEKSGCTGNGKLISLRDLCPTPSTIAPTIAPDDQEGLSAGAIIGLVIGIIVVVVIVLIGIYIVWKRRQKTKRRRMPRSPFRRASSPNVYEDPDSPPLARRSKDEDEEADRNGKVASETEPHPTGSSPSSPPETPLAPLHPPAHLLMEKQFVALSSHASDNGEIKRAPRRGYHRQPSLASGKSPSTENLTDSPLADAEAEGDSETEIRPSPAKPILKKDSPRGQMSLRSHSIDIHVSPPRDSNHTHETNTEDAFASENNAIGLQDHNIMYHLLERVKEIQKQVDELVGKQDEDAKESRESLKKIENMQKQLQDILQPRLPIFPVHHHRHVRRSSEPLLKAKSHPPPKQRPMNHPTSPLVMPAPPSFEASPAPNQGKSRSESQRGGSQSSIASVVSVGDIQKRINNFERTLNSARNAMSRLEGKVANMDTETGTKKNQESILRELTEIRSCVEIALTMMLEKASVAFGDGFDAGNTLETEPDVSWFSHSSPAGLPKESGTEETGKVRSNQVVSSYSAERSDVFYKVFTDAQPTSENLHIYVDERLVTCLRKGTVSGQVGVEGGSLALPSLDVSLTIPPGAITSAASLDVTLSLFVSSRAVNVGGKKAYVGVIELLPHKAVFSKPVLLRHELKHHFKLGPDCVETHYSLFYGEGIDPSETYDYMGSLESAHRHFSYKDVTNVYLRDSYLELSTKSFCRYCSVVRIDSFHVVMSFFVRPIGVYVNERRWNMRIAASCSCPENLKKIQEDVQHGSREKFSFVDKKHLYCRNLDKQRLEFSLSEEDTFTPTEFTLLFKKQFSGQELLSVVENNDRLPNYLDKDCVIKCSATVNCSQPVAIAFKYYASAELLSWDHVLVPLGKEASSEDRSSDSTCNGFSNSWEHFQTRVSNGVQGISTGAVGSQTVLPSASSVQDQADSLLIPNEVDRYLKMAVAELTKAKWKRLFLNLELDHRNISRYGQEDDDFVKTFQVICDWKDQHGKKASVNVLMTACNEIGICTDEIVDEYRRKKSLLHK